MKMTTKFYPLADRHPKQKFAPLKSIGFEGSKNIKAIGTGIRRYPKKGEWYLSGAIVNAYKAFEDLSIVYEIAKIVEVEEIEFYRIKEYLS